MKISLKKLLFVGVFSTLITSSVNGEVSPSINSWEVKGFEKFCYTTQIYDPNIPRTVISQGIQTEESNIPISFWVDSKNIEYQGDDQYGPTLSMEQCTVQRYLFNDVMYGGEHKEVVSNIPIGSGYRVVGVSHYRTFCPRHNWETHFTEMEVKLRDVIMWDSTFNGRRIDVRTSTQVCNSLGKCKLESVITPFPEFCNQDDLDRVSNRGMR